MGHFLSPRYRGRGVQQYDGAKHEMAVLWPLSEVLTFFRTQDEAALHRSRPRGLRRRDHKFEQGPRELTHTANDERS